MNCVGKIATSGPDEIRMQSIFLHQDEATVNLEKLSIERVVFRFSSFLFLVFGENPTLRRMLVFDSCSRDASGIAHVNY